MSDEKLYYGEKLYKCYQLLDIRKKDFLNNFTWDSND